MKDITVLQSGRKTKITPPQGGVFRVKPPKTHSHWGRYLFKIFILPTAPSTILLATKIKAQWLCKRTEVSEHFITLRLLVARSCGTPE